jgi:hypothetical protein
MWRPREAVAQQATATQAQTGAARHSVRDDAAKPVGFTVQ